MTAVAISIRIIHSKQPNKLRKDEENTEND